MHLENLAPLLRLLPLALAGLLALAGFVWLQGGRKRREMRQSEERERRYWVAELAYRARFRARDWLGRTKTLRLTYQGPPLADRPSGKSRRRK